jgi:hypothetical protein
MMSFRYRKKFSVRVTLRMSSRVAQTARDLTQASHALPIFLNPSCGCEVPRLRSRGQTASSTVFSAVGTPTYFSRYSRMNCTVL